MVRPPGYWRLQLLTQLKACREDACGMHEGMCEAGNDGMH